MALHAGDSFRFDPTTPTPVRVPVEIRFEGSDHLEAGFQADVGETGMFVGMTRPPPVGSLLQFELRMDEIRSVRGFAEVVWVRLRAEGESLCGMGARYRLLAGNGAEVIQQRIQDVR